MLIELSDLFAKYHINPTGVLHIGASTGQEAESYHKHGLKVVWVEAIPGVYKQLCRNVTKYTGTICLNACVSDKDGEIVDFNISNNEGQSSSMLEFGTHSQAHPGIVYIDKIRLHTLRIDTLLKSRDIPAYEYDFVNLDIQGTELKALKGMDLSQVRYVYIEVNEKELYKKCALLPEIDEYLKGFDLHRVETKMTHWGWGDAFYIRKGREVNNMVQVPDHFRPKHPFAYPGDNEPDFEQWYYQQYKGSTGRIYLPIMWTAFYCKADRELSRRQQIIQSLQHFINSLDKSKKYYTVVQYDDGILNDLSGLDIKVFSMSGQPMDYCLPLTCKPHQYFAPVTKDIFASFIGRNTHPIRTELLKLKEPGWLVTDKILKMNEFCSILNRSVFTLCPRGYGPTSFRISECMQYNSIPVYISDSFLQPCGIDFETYGVIVPAQRIKDLKSILSDVDIEAKRKYLQPMYEEYFTFSGCASFIYAKLKAECSL